jgi:hypothetical protein
MNGWQLRNGFSHAISALLFGISRDDTAVIPKFF